MKKIFLNLLIVGVLASTIVSCQSDNKKKGTDSTKINTKADSLSLEKETADSTRAANAVPITPAEVEKAKVPAPSFTNEEVNAGFNEFATIRKNYETALKDKNTTAAKAARQEYNSWILRAVTWGAKLPQEENQKYIEYYEKTIKQWEIVERQAANK